MNISDLDQKFRQDKVFQTEFAAALAKNVHQNGVPDEHSDFSIEQDDNDQITALSIGESSPSAKYQLLVADAALKTLKDKGVTDFTGINGPRKNIDTKAWNVVYKGGGWIVNGMKPQGRLEVGDVGEIGRAGGAIGNFGTGGLGVGP